MKKTFLTFIIFALAACNAPEVQTQTAVTGWRAGDGTGSFTAEKRLLKSWPAEGPEKVMVINGIGEGYSSPVISDGKILVAGKRDTLDVLHAYTLKGEKLWETVCGNGWNRSYEQNRSTPRIEGNKVWVATGMAQYVCLDVETGKILWTRDLFKDYGGVPPFFGYSESPLVVNDLVVYNIGGNQTLMVALDKNSGNEVWKTEPFDRDPAYCTSAFITHNGIPMIVSVSANFIFAVNPANGQLLWKFDYAHIENAPDRDTNNNTNTPIYHDGKLFVTSGYNHGAVMLEIAPDGKSVKQVWLNKDFDTQHGGVVKVGNYLYGSTWDSNANGKWLCADWNTGETKYFYQWLNKGVTITADEMLYCYEEKGGTLALVRPVPEKFDVVSSFKVTDGSGSHWAHPVICDGLLYVRHGDALAVYRIK